MTLTREQFQKARDSGLSVEQIVEFEKRRQTEQPVSTQNPTDSIATQGLSYVKEHPFKSFFNPAAKTITGKSFIERSQEVPISAKMTGNPVLDPIRAGVAGVGALKRDIGAYAADFATTPSTYVGIPAIKLAGKSISSTKNVIGKFFNFNKKGLDLATKVRGVAAEAKSSAVEKFGKTLDDLANANPDKSISL